MIKLEWMLCVVVYLTILYVATMQGMGHVWPYALAGLLSVVGLRELRRREVLGWSARHQRALKAAALQRRTGSPQ